MTPTAPLTQREVAELLGVSRQRVGVLEAKALAKLRRRLTADPDLEELLAWFHRASRRNLPEP